MTVARAARGAVWALADDPLAPAREGGHWRWLREGLGKGLRHPSWRDDDMGDPLGMPGTKPVHLSSVSLPQVVDIS